MRLVLLVMHVENVFYKLKLLYRYTYIYIYLYIYIYIYKYIFLVVYPCSIVLDAFAERGISES